jgi:hypothetical protein
MGSLYYIPQKSRLLLLFKAARMRLIATSENVSLLSEARITSATEEINQISDDILDAKGATSSNRADAATLASKPADSEVFPLPTTVAVSPALEGANPGAN